MSIFFQKNYSPNQDLNVYILLKLITFNIVIFYNNTSFLLFLNVSGSISIFIPNHINKSPNAETLRIRMTIKKQNK